MFRVETKLETQRWFVIVGWQAPLPLADAPAESPVNVRVECTSPASVKLDCWQPVVLRGVTDAEGFVYANNCTAFPSIDASGQFHSNRVGPLDAAAHEEKEALDYVRQRTWRRVSKLATAQLTQPICNFEICHQEQTSNEADDVNRDIVEKPSKTHELELRNKSNSTLCVCIYAESSQKDLYQQVGHPFQLGFGKSCVVKHVNTVSESQHIAVISPRIELFASMMGVGQLNDVSSSQAGVLLYAKIAVGQPTECFYMITNIVNSTPSHPMHIKVDNSVADIPLIRHDHITIKALSKWKWFLERSTGHWSDRKAATLVRAASESNHVQHAADVRIMPGLSEEEIAFRDLRWNRCKAALRSFLPNCSAEQVDDRDLPKIGFCYSGGGVRALINALGATLGANSIGLYDTCLYSSGLSGGSWFLALWSERPSDDQGKLGDFVDSLRKAFSEHPFLIGPKRTAWIWEAVQKVVAFKPDRQVALSDIYGLLLALQWTDSLNEVGPSRLQRWLSDQSKILKHCNADRPIPIYTAVHPDAEIPGGYEWYEFTPWQVRALDSCSSVPSWAFGRHFVDGHSIETCPEVPMGTLLGTFGSAFCASIEEMESNIGYQHTVLFQMIRGLSDSRLVPPPQFYNPSFAFSALNGQPVASKRVLNLIDAGCCVNAPIPPLIRSERELDVIFVFDARPTDFDVNDSKDVLRKWIEFATAKGFNKPRIDFHGVGTRTLTVIRDTENSEMPLMVYMPLVKNEAFSQDFDPASHNFADFTKFAYSEQNFETLCGLAKMNMMENVEQIRTILRNICDDKRNRRLNNENVKQL